MTRSTAHRFHLLDALRGLAAIIVVARHAPADLAILLPTFNSFLAVDFFFCLSGFVIAYSYESRLKGDMRLLDFSILRVIRLYPLAILGTVAGLVFALLRQGLWSSVTHGPLLGAVLLSLCILPNLVAPMLGPALLPFNDPGWSLFFEMVANVTFAAMLRLRLAQTWVLVAIAGISLVAMIRLGAPLSSIDGGVRFSTFGLGLARVGVSFCIGVLLFRAQRKNLHFSFQGRSAIGMAALCAGVLVAFLTVSVPLTRSLLFQISAVLLFFPAIVYVGSRVALPTGWTSPCTFLGDMSYPLYILHHPLVSPSFSANLARLASTHPALRLFGLPVYILFLGAATWWIGKYLDEPFRKSITNKYKQLRQRSA